MCVQGENRLSAKRVGSGKLRFVCSCSIGRDLDALERAGEIQNRGHRVEQGSGRAMLLMVSSSTQPRPASGFPHLETILFGRKHRRRAAVEARY